MGSGEAAQEVEVGSNELFESGESATPTASLSEDQDDWIRFQQLAEAWIFQRGASSSITETVACEAYQRIIGMGERALRPIFRQIESEGSDPDQWFWALQMITGKNPVDRTDQGDFHKMAQVWLQWGRREGYAR